MKTCATYALAISAVVALVFSAGCPEQSEPEALSQMGQDMMDESDTMPPPELAGGETHEEESLMVRSSAFNEGDRIPTEYTADGEGISPPLEFSGVPDDAVALALVMHDPDAPRAGGFTHWVVYHMSPDISKLPEGIPGAEVVEDHALTQGENSRGDIGYTGPAPPKGDEPHRYQFTLYALSEKLDLAPGATKEELESAMQGKIVDQTTLTGMYGR